MDYKKTGIEVFNSLGGNDNVKQLTHCATRLRFELNDLDIVDREEIKKIKGVLDIILSGGQVQVIIGQDVQIAYKAANEIFKGSTNSSTGNEKSDNTLTQRFMAMVMGIFAPTVPAIIGSGMIGAVLVILRAVGWVDVDSSTFFVLSFVSDATFFFFLPMILAYSTAVYFKTNVSLAITISGVFLHPNFRTALQSGEALDFFGFNIPLVNYASSVFPIILTIVIMSYVDKFAERFLPSVVKFVMKPLVILAITVPVALLIVGPVGYYGGSMLGVSCIMGVSEPALYGVTIPLKKTMFIKLDMPGEEE